MGRRSRKGNPISGWVILDKPLGMTSTQALGAVKRILKPQKAGHAGTLDPLATGILPIALGEATKTVSHVQDRGKIYRFSVKWGEARETDDSEGEIIASSDIRPDAEAIRAILPAFTGEIEQVPPKYSAIKIGGERAYDLARAGEEVEIPVRTVRIDTLELIAHHGDTTEFETHCGKGTYVRALGRDMALKLGTFGYISALRRLAVGSFNEKCAISLDELSEIAHSAPPEEYLLSVKTALDDIPALAMTREEANRLTHGQTLAMLSRQDKERLIAAGIEPGEYSGTALALENDKPIALVMFEGAEVKPVRVLNL